MKSLPSARCGRISLSLVCLAAFLLLLSLAAPALRAQGLSGISGTVTDPSGAVVSGAKILATNDATGVASHTVTSSAGSYTITDLIPGVYTVRVEATGFATSVQRNVHVDVSRVSNADVALITGSV